LFSAGEINRSEEELVSFGGKGINVSAILSRLGVGNRALGFVGGFSGKEIERLSRRAGIECDFCEISENSRINVKIISDKETAINGKGPLIREEEEQKLLEKLSALSEEDTVIISGKSPESESGELLCRVIDAAAHTRLVADMEGEDLLFAIERKPFLIKPNREELEAISGRTLSDEGEVARLAAELRARGAKNVLVSLGGDGAILAADDGKIYRARAPRVEVRSTVGAGDSCLAGFIAGYDKGFDFALSLAMAAGSATAASAALAEGEEIMKIFSEM
ncbi:MAG: hexose kinase, partial [Oscillospiraceae bacterium]|nr:hexose kinase [Oscillospiraceae bacterium]